MANYAYIEKGNIVGLYDSLLPNWKNVSNFYVLNDEEIRPFGWRKIIKNDPDYDPSTHMLGEKDYYILGDEVYERTQVVLIPPPPPIPEISPEEIAFNTAKRWEEVRRERDRIMADFQWRYSRYERQTRLGLTTSDSLENMDNYMQALADITMQEDPFNIVWPGYIN